MDHDFRRSRSDSTVYPTLPLFQQMLCSYCFTRSLDIAAGGAKSTRRNEPSGFRLKLLAGSRSPKRIGSCRLPQVRGPFFLALIWDRNTQNPRWSLVVRKERVD